MKACKIVMSLDNKKQYGKPMIVEGKITPLTKEDNEPGYDFKFVEEKAL